MGQNASTTATDQGTGPRTSQSPRLQDTWGPACPPRELRLLLLGRRGAGKSATGNTILGRAAFLTSSSEQTATKMCQRKSDYTEGWKVVVIDTPDIFSSMSPVEDQCHHVGQCLELSAPILHALLLVIPVGHDRAEDRETMEGIQKAFGAEARRHTLVIFTRGDELEGGSIQDYTNSSEALRRMLANYGYRYCAFNNKADEEERLSQVRELLHTVQRMVEENGEPYRVACGRAGDALQPRVSPNPRLLDKDMAGHRENTLRIVLVGKTGNGKSATANTILGERAFKSKISAHAVTPTCQRALRDWKGRELLVVDTPGLFDTKEALQTTCEEISRCVLFSCPGPHAIVLVLQLGRYTREEQNTVALLKAVFGESAMKHMMVLFTRKDGLEGQRLSAFIDGAGDALKQILAECGERYCAFSNVGEPGTAESDAQVQELVELIDQMVRGNKGAHFSDAIYKDTEERLERQAEVLKKIYADKLENDIERIKMSRSTQTQKEEEIKRIKMKYEEQIKNIREEAEKKEYASVSKHILSIVSKIWHLFW